MRLVKDTNVFVAALKSGAGASRELLRRLLLKKHNPLMGDKLFFEYSELIQRKAVWGESLTEAKDRAVLLAAFADVCEWVPIFRIWRPNLLDAGDDHVMELCIAGNAAALVTFNKRDFKAARFAPAGMDLTTPAEFLKRYST